MRANRSPVLLSALVFALAPHVSAQAAAERGGSFTLEHYARVARVNGLRVSPAGSRAVMVVAWPNYKTDTWDSDIVLVDLRTKAQRTLTQHHTVAAPRWSPNGDRLAFLARVDKKSQLFVMPANGGKAKQVTREPNGVGGFAWKPDGSGFAYTASPKDPPHNKFDDSFLASANDYLMQAATRSVRIYAIPATGGEPAPINTAELTLSALGAALTWSPDGRSLAVGVQAGPGTRYFPKRSVALIDVTTGAISKIPGLDGRFCGSVTPSPDGKHLLASCPVGGHVQNQSELVVVPPNGGEVRQLTAVLDRNFSRAVWSADSRYVIAQAPDSVGSGVWEVPLDGSPRRLHVGNIGVGELDAASDGTIAFIGTEAQRPPELFVLRAGATAPERITNIHAEVAALSLGKQATITWQSDGFPLSGVFTFPPNFDPSRKYPLLLDIHGGPWGSSLEHFASQTQLFAAQGWIIFEPNYRGSDNVGNAFYSAVYRDHGAGPGRDVMAGLALVKQRSYVDTTRIGVSGWSYGGYMTTWLIGHYGGWKAAMAGAAVIDLVDDYNLNDLSLYMRAFGETLSFPADLALMKEQSPLTYVDEMRTPLMLLSDAGDARVPVTQSYKLYNALKERGRDVQMRLWPVAGHFPADPFRARDIDQKWMEFFRERFK